MLKQLAIIAGVTLALSASAKADVKQYYQSGGWTNYAGTGNDGLVCGMSIKNRDASQSVHFKYFAKSDKIYVQVFKASWRIPEGTKVAIEVGFDKEAWGGVDDAYGETMTGSTGYKMGVITVPINPKSVSSFLQQASEANNMWLRFPSGNETTWTADMTGSRSSVVAFKMCITKVGGNGNTQPYGNTQPFGNNTQPFGKNEKPDTGGDKQMEKPSPAFRRKPGEGNASIQTKGREA